MNENVIWADTDDEPIAWQPDGWWRVIDPDGDLWCESSDEQENRKAMRPGDTLYRHEKHVEQRWVEVSDA